MIKYSVFLLLTALFFRVDPVYSVFGAEDVPLEDYYVFGKHQTGVASVHADRSYGTANLIDVKDIGIPSLKGRLGSLEGKVLITAAHVIYDRTLQSCKDPQDCSIRFMDENNESQKMDVLALFAPDEYPYGDDIGIIVLKESVDVGKFKPLKLNLSADNTSFSGKLVNIFGCTPVFGKANSNVVIRERGDSLLRRGMTTVLDECSNDKSKLYSNFYTSKGMISIIRDSTKAFTKIDEERNHKIKKEIECFDNLLKNVESSADKLILIGERIKLIQEQLNLREIETRKGLSKTIFYNGLNIKTQLDILEDTEDLDKSRLISEWEHFIKDGKYGNKGLDLGAYQVKFYGILPRLNGQVYHGDSGGAWVIDDKIVALTQIGSTDRKLSKVKKSLNTSRNVSEYFTECENILFKSQSLISDDEAFLHYGATSI